VLLCGSVCIFIVRCYLLLLYTSTIDRDGLNIKGLRIAYLNVCSLRNKIQDILEEKNKKDIWGEKLK